MSQNEKQICNAQHFVLLPLSFLPFSVVSRFALVVVRLAHRASYPGVFALGSPRRQHSNLAVSGVTSLATVGTV